MNTVIPKFDEAVFEGRIPLQVAVEQKNGNTIHSELSISNSPNERLQKSRIDLKNELLEPQTCLEIQCKHGFSTIGTLGNFSLYIGEAKSRKTFFVILLIAAFIAGKFFMNKLNAIVKNGKNRIMVFDTEQATYHVQLMARRILQSAGVLDPENLDVYSLRAFDTRQRLELIEWAIYNTGGVAIVVIDGIRDLVYDINNAEEASFISNKLLKWTEERNIHIITVLHQNKADNNARGHVGAELVNKAESVLSIAKDQNNPESISLVTPEYFRGKEFEPFAFSINEEGLPYLVDDWTPDNNDRPGRLAPNAIPDHFHSERLREVFKVVNLPSYGQLWKQIKAAFVGFQKVGDNTAKDLLSYYLQKEWIIKIDPPKSEKKWATYDINLV